LGARVKEEEMEKMFWLSSENEQVAKRYCGTSLTLMMLLTVSDVVGRAFGHPIMGTFEVVGFMLALVIGFAMPRSRWPGSTSTWIL